LEYTDMMNPSRRRGPLSTSPDLKSKVTAAFLALVSNPQTLPVVLFAALLASYSLTLAFRHEGREMLDDREAAPHFTKFAVAYPSGTRFESWRPCEGASAAPDAVPDAAA
jgi:hypothetical protein